MTEQQLAEIDLTGKVALVTGATRGLGREIALGLARHGASVVISSRKADACARVASEVSALSGRETLAHACHVGHWDELNGLVDASYHRFGKVDVLINNAGISPLYEDIAGVTEALYDKVLDVNLKGPFRLSALVGSRMVAGDGGSIVNISSIASIQPTRAYLPYAAAKAGLNAITVGFAEALGPKVRVNCIVAGAFQTDVTRSWDWKVTDRIRESSHLKRIGEPREIVGAVLYFASDQSSFTTGALLRVDGGR